MLGIVLTQPHSASKCDFYFPKPITLSRGNRIGDIIVGEVLEISFELKFNASCPTNWCHLFRITDGDGAGDIRLPLFNIRAEGQYLRITYSDSNATNSRIQYSNQSILSTKQNNRYHTYYAKFSYYERLFIYDGIVYTNITNGSYNNS